ncbi:hypothetical protein DPMN_096220 [Dreissena polymorpha]|uniref:Uncharacterized protein n=1 Tax=Dreissena polymorpha TaxID=45954 RepID=A0A9D4L8B2_DREPO|nr:hypothetical protein DPMN_096220 [Dreissena polymorpha]
MKKGRPRDTWRRDLDADAKQMGQAWGQLEILAQNREEADWRPTSQKGPWAKMR